MDVGKGRKCYHESNSLHLRHLHPSQILLNDSTDLNVLDIYK